MPYQLLISKKTLDLLASYKYKLANNLQIPGPLFLEELSKQEQSVNKMDLTTFAQLLIQTKKPQVFAESQQHDGSDWTLDEERILGDVTVNMAVTMYNDGGHGASYKIHEPPIEGYLAYVPGALLATGGSATADMQELIDEDGKLRQERLDALYERRLLPQLVYFNALAQQQNKKVALTIPGIGSGCFSGTFYEVIKPCLRKALISLFERHKDSLPFIGIVHYDPYVGDRLDEKKLGHISFRVSPSSVAPKPTGQLAYPDGSSPDTHLLVSIVAWDHFSWPGNDYWGGARQTDDGVKAASTDTMLQVTGVDGLYSKSQGRYLPPIPFRGDWGDYARAHKLVFNGPILVLNEQGLLCGLEDTAPTASISSTRAVSLFRGKAKEPVTLGAQQEFPKPS
jgi:hypothetical protein